jgi:hypothetical protein
MLLIVLLTLFFLAGFVFGVAYSENSSNVQHKIWKDYLDSKEKGYDVEL